MGNSDNGKRIFFAGYEAGFQDGSSNQGQEQPEGHWECLKGKAKEHETGTESAGEIAPLGSRQVTRWLAAPVSTGLGKGAGSKVIYINLDHIESIIPSANCFQVRTVSGDIILVTALSKADLASITGIP